MKALRWHAQKDIRLEDIPETELRPGWVKLRVKWCGICGTDLHEYLGGPIFIPAGQPHPLTGEQAPVTLGHEFSGEVVEVADDVTDFKPGDRVTVEPIVKDFDSEENRRGLYNLDPKLGFYGLAGWGGGFSEYAALPAYMLHRLPDNVSYEQAALTEPAAVALHAVRQSRLKVGDTAAVFGAGPIGLLIVDALKASGASKIFVVESSEERRSKAASLGAETIDPRNTDPVEAIRKATGGGVDVSYEVTGVGPVLSQCLDAVRPQGEMMVVSVWEKPAELDPNEILMSEKHVSGIIGYRDIFPATLALMERGYFKTEDFVTAKIALDNVEEQGFGQLLSDKSQVKILVSPDLAAQ